MMRMTESTLICFHPNSRSDSERASEGCSPEITCSLFRGRAVGPLWSMRPRCLSYLPSKPVAGRLHTANGYVFYLTRSGEMCDRAQVGSGGTYPTNNPLWRALFGRRPEGVQHNSGNSPGQFTLYRTSAEIRPRGRKLGLSHRSQENVACSRPPKSKLVLRGVLQKK